MMWGGMKKGTKVQDGNGQAGGGRRAYLEAKALVGFQCNAVCHSDRCWDILESTKNAISQGN